MRWESRQSKFNKWWKAAALWHVWFAWYPVVTGNGTTVWLEKVQRRRDSADWLYEPIEKSVKYYD